MEAMKALFHINENNRWKMVLANIDNLIKDVGWETVIVEVVANGTAVSIFHSADNSIPIEIKDIERLASLGIRFSACRNSLRGLKINENEIPGFITIVSAGITEIIIRQQQGYAYVKP